MRCIIYIIVQVTKGNMIHLFSVPQSLVTMLLLLNTVTLSHGCDLPVVRLLPFIAPLPVVGLKSLFCLLHCRYTLL